MEMGSRMAELDRKTKFDNAADWFADLDRFNSEPFMLERNQPIIEKQDRQISAPVKVDVPKPRKKRSKSNR
jgi:hypothetical protein